jgi:glutamine amidotransferase
MVSYSNPHPQWMHNGAIAGFEQLKRSLQDLLPDPIYHIPQGNTDSEWAFALFLSLLDPVVSVDSTTPFPHTVLRHAMLATISTLNSLARSAGITEPSLLNFCITDGETVVATRYVSSKHDEAASLYYSSGTTFSEDATGVNGSGHYRMSKLDKRENIIMIASEPLTFEKADWLEIRTNTMVVVTPKMNLLQIPIVDEFHVPPSYAHIRAVEFAATKGLLNPKVASSCA